MAAVAALFTLSAVLPAEPPRPVPCRSVERRPSPARPDASLRPSLDVGSDGRVTGLSVGGETVPSLGVPGGFSVRPVGGTPNVLANGGFETAAAGAPSGWRLTSGASPPTLDERVARSGRRSLRLSADGGDPSGTAVTAVPVRPGTYYVLTAWFRTRDVEPAIATAVREPVEPHPPVRIRVEQPSEGGFPERAQAHAYTGTAGWHRRSVGFRTGPGVRRVLVRAVVEEGSGTAWVDDVSVSELLARRPATPREVRVSERAGETTRILAEYPGAGLRLDARLRPTGDHVEVRGAVRALDARDRAFQATFTIPVDASGWRWGDYVRRDRPIERGAYGYLSTSSLQRTSRYPFGAIWNDRWGLGLGIPLSDPRIFRILYDTERGLSITFDLGVSSDAERLEGGATFSFVLFPFDPAWGFRAATDRYHRLFPDSFVRRTDPACEGAWFVAPPLYGLDPRDFGLGLNMVALGKASSQRHETWGTRYIRWDDAQGIYTTAYQHHWAYYDPVGSGPTPEYDRALAALRADATAGRAGSRLRREAEGALASTARDENGRLRYERYREYLAYYQNLDPDPDRGDWPEAAMREQVERAVRTARSAGGRLDGIHLDSTSGMRRWGAADDYDRRHWAVATAPLTFSYDSGEVVVRGIFPMHGHLRRVARHAHDRRMFLSANFNADEARALGFAGADAIDYFGLEQGLVDRVTPEVSLDQFAMLKRTLAHQRPISTLDHRIGLVQLGAGEIEARLQHNLFYGIFSGAFSAPVEADAGAAYPTWSTAENRAIWARYTPLLRALSTAGWEPLTLAVSSNPSVWVERFGAAERGDLHLTLRNQTAGDQTFVLAVDLSGAGPTAEVRAIELVTGAALPARLDGERALVEGRIPAGSTRVVAVETLP